MTKKELLANVIIFIITIIISVAVGYSILNEITNPDSHTNQAFKFCENKTGEQEIIYSDGTKETLLCECYSGYATCDYPMNSWWTLLLIAVVTLIVGIILTYFAPEEPKKVSKK